MNINESQEKEYKFSNINIERVNNGFIVELDKRSCTPICSDNIHVFNTLEDLSSFIKELK